jgi:cytochrome c peroxidase
LLVCWTSAAGCHGREPATAPPPPSEPSHDRELEALRTFEQERRAGMDFATLPPSDQVMGPDPYRIAALPGGGFVGILRGESAIVLLDATGAETARLAAPRSPSGLAVSRDGDALVVGDGAREIAHYRVEHGRLAQVATLPVAAIALRGIALAPDGKTAYVTEEHDGRLLAIALDRTRAHAFRATSVREIGRCHGPLQVAAVAGAVAVNCVLDHAIEIHRDRGEPTRIQHDGPMWSLAVRGEPDGGLLIAAGGVEDHPLEREDGGFGYIDSFVYVDRLAPGAAAPVQLAAFNTSALGVVTPKWVAIDEVAGSTVVTATGYAGAGRLTLRWPAGDFAAAPAVDQTALPPGTSDAQLLADGTLVAANPLFDAWVVERGGAPRVVPVATAQPTRSVQSRLGELLFFTTMMAPWNSSDGKLSRFTCETCHHEGYVDGRVHFTGRDTVHAATRPLYGLFNNRPHFSRALDKTTTQMVHAEFRVANRHNGRDPWFTLTRADVPWLGLVADAPAQLSPEYLRESFMTFLGDFTHRANPAAIDHAQFTELERTGAQVFRDRCASCHAARLIADAPGSVVPFERWEPLVLSASGPIVWSNAGYAKTSVTPYVHPDGARAPALRRLYKKWPYFTNGSARSLADVLDRFATTATATYHDAAPADPAIVRLTADDKAALLAFLDLL